MNINNLSRVTAVFFENNFLLLLDCITYIRLSKYSDK